jgi:sterol desaturase/sphingolipid hydroxylase (fatty acid hydroxylase superfamily)
MTSAATETALAVLRQFLLFGMLLTPLELLRPARPQQPLLRRGLLTDLFYFAINPFLINIGVAVLLGALSAAIGWLWPLRLRTLLFAQPLAVQLVEIFILSEIGGYWVHRLSHRVHFLWRFHAVHHGNRELDWLAAHRQHPVEAIWLLGVANLPVLLLGFPVDSMLFVVLIQKLYTAFLHANVRVGYGRLGILLASPQFHHWHHDGSPTTGGALAGNFSAALPLLDRLWGSYRMPADDAFPDTYGIEEPLAKDYPRQLLHPFRNG